MANMSKRNRMLFVAFMLTALLQMAQFALTPGIAKIQAEVFPNLSLSVIQTAMTLPSLISMVFALISAFLISKHLLSKKRCVIIGISFMAVTGLASLVFHSQFWHLCMLSVLIGTGMGFYISTSTSIAFDNFNEAERRLSVGYQTSAINFGGIIMSIGGGFLATLIWYGGYLMLFLSVPIIIVCILTIPDDRKKASGETHDKKHVTTKIPGDVFYYGVITFFFLLIYNVCGTNISNHLKAANIGNTATAGIATAVQMAGGVAAGFVFSRLSAKFRDYVIAFSFVIVFIGFTIVNIGQHSLFVDFIGVFIVGTSISILVPQCLFSTSNHVNAANSATSTAIVNCIFPGVGGFLSPVVFTNLTMALAGESTNFRFEFVGAVSLVFGIVLIITTRARERKENIVPMTVPSCD